MIDIFVLLLTDHAEVILDLVRFPTPLWKWVGFPIPPKVRKFEKVSTICKVKIQQSNVC